MDAGQNKEKLLQVHVAARRLGVTPRQVRYLVNQGKLQAIRLSERNIRISEASLESYQKKLNQ